MRAAAAGMEGRHGAVASGACPDLDARERRRRAARVPGARPGTGSEEQQVRYLQWTADVPVIYPPYTCANEIPGRSSWSAYCSPG